MIRRIRIILFSHFIILSLFLPPTLQQQQQQQRRCRLSVASAFQPSRRDYIQSYSTIRRHRHHHHHHHQLQLNPEILSLYDDHYYHLLNVQQQQQQLSDSLLSLLLTLSISFTPLPASTSALSSSSYFLSSSILLIANKEVVTDEWRQYVPLIVSVGVILDILLGSPLANMVLSPMKRASEKGVVGGKDSATTSTKKDDYNNESGGRGSLFSEVVFGDNENTSRRTIGGGRKERVDSEAIAQAALNKALNTLELKRFLEENKTDEQRYEEVRKKIDKQMEELGE